MKAKEVLRRYAAGERNFQRVNLRGQSFKGQDLSGADFSEADIRGTNFKNANLQGANFTGAKAGLKKYWKFNTGLIVFSLVASELLENTTSTFIVTLLISVYVILVALQYNSTFNGTLLTTASVLILAGLISLALTQILFFILDNDRLLFISPINLVGFIPIAFGLMGFICVVVIGSESGIISSAINRQIRGSRNLFVSAVKEVFINAITNTGGTNFQRANLTEVNFQYANLNYTNFINSNIELAIWLHTKKLNFARFSYSYLQNPKIQLLLVKGEGQKKTFDFLDLSKINLFGANLKDTSFISANLSEANLQDADLSRAKLVQTQLDKTDLTGANLTGAFIEDWNITVNTKLRGVRCDYIYLRLPTQEDPDPHRKPDNRNEIFADGDFEDFIKPIFDTLDLYHNQDIDPRAISLAWKKLAENNPDAELESRSSRST